MQVSQVLSASVIRRPYDPSPLKVIFSAELEDLHYGNAPYDPETQEWLVRRAANVIRKEMDAGIGIVAHCMGGIGGLALSLDVYSKILAFPLMR